MNRWQGICLSAALVSLFAPLAHVHAQTVVTPEDEYKKLVRVNEDIQPLGEHPLGENISLYDGSLSFRHTDVSLSGNGPILELSRILRIEGERKSGQQLAQHTFGDWLLELPHLETFTGEGYTRNTGLGWHAVTGWEVNVAQNGGDYNHRCTKFDVPPLISQHIGDPALVAWEPESWWKGYHLVLPGQGSQDLLVNPDAATRSTYPIVTKSQWRVSCLLNTANGQPGEGFLAQSPDGTRYWFNHLVYDNAPGMSRPLYSDGLSKSAGPRGGFFESLIASHPDPIGDLLSLLSGSSLAHALPTSNTLNRKTARMLVTKIEDRFGNFLTFSYDTFGKLIGIVASDGRALSVQYISGTGVIQSVTLQPSSGTARTWTYTYNAALTSLTSMTAPDGSQWQYGLASLSSASLDTSITSSCAVLATPSNLNPVTGTVTQPSGLVGTFTVKPFQHVRSNVTQDCRGTAPYGYPDTAGSYAFVPNAWYGLSITQRVLAGAGVPAATWSYNYSQAAPSWSTCGPSCPTTVYSDVVSPDGSTVRSTFSNKYDYTESQLVSVDYYVGAAGQSSVLRSAKSYYAPPTTAPFPLNVGYSLQSNINTEQTTRYSPLNKRTITENGNDYIWQAQAFNSYAQVTQTRRLANITGQTAVVEQTTYLNDVGNWVLGLPKQTKNVNYNQIVDEYEYDLTHVTLLWRKRFGQTLMNYTFNSAGQLASFTDGDNHTTSLSNYKRGIPQTISTPDNKTQTLVVDDFGQIGSLTDQAGSVTSYTYDPIGRLTGITYPTGDEQAWLPETFAYAYVTSAENGVAAGHWRRTVAHGNARTVSYFDALLRPVLSTRYINGVSGSNITQRTDYDWKGQTTFASYPVAGLPTLASITAGASSTYDALGRLTQTQQNSELGLLTTTTAYLSGARQQVIDPKGNVSTVSYQVFDQPAYDAVIQVAAPAGLTQVINRDLYGHPLSIRQYGTYNGLSGDVTKTLVYDAYHRLCRTTEPESASSVVAYDSANNLAWSAAGLDITGTGCGQEQVLAAARTTRTYDPMNRLLTILPPSGTQSTAYTYDALGNPKTAVSGISHWSASYNRRSTLTGETLSLPGQPAKTLTWTHDTYGSISQLTYPDGETVAYAPDALGRSTRVGSYLTGIGYFPNGEVAQGTLGNGALYVAEQNARLLLSNQSYGKGSTLNLSEDLTYDKNANLTQVIDLAGGPRTKTFGYDALNRLTSATATALWGSETYAYDPINNLRSRVNGSQATTYNYDTQNRLSSLTGTAATSFGYDTRGNLTSKGGVTLSFDQSNQLLGLPGVSYAYDAAGRRVRKTVSGVDTYYFYSQGGQLLYQWQPAANKTTNLIALGRQPIARSVRVGAGAPTITYTYADAQGTPLLEANASGTVTATLDYKPYGSQALGAAPDGIGYTGHVNDPDTGFVYMQARYYDPAVGRFLSVDPVGPSPGALFGFNRYDYANNNPINHTDPDGRCADGMSCDTMVQNYGAWANANPAEADQIGRDVGVPAVAVMLIASGAGEAVAMVKGAVTLDRILSKGEQLSKNVKQGADAETSVAKRLGDEVAGKRVTLESTTGKRSVADIVTKDKGVVEVKSGGARLSSGQKAVKADIDAGRPVTPRGKNAANAGLEPGKPTVMKCYQVDRC